MPKTFLRRSVGEKLGFLHEEEGEGEGEVDFKYGLLWFCMDYYGFVWICELLYGFLDSWSSSLSRVLL